MASSELDTQSSILVLHDSTLDPYPFLARTEVSEDPLRDHVPWKIDNKYYTTDVAFRPHMLGMAPEAHPVILYLFSGHPPEPLPPSLTRLSVLDPPPDISLAIRVRDGEEGFSPSSLEDDERFDELGMEIVDELGEADDDDERPMDPLETVRQTLMTHMWPGMVRKAAAGSRTDIPRPDIMVDDEGSGDESSAQPQFPVSFRDRSQEITQTPGPSSDFPAVEATPESPPNGYSVLPIDGDEFGDFSQGPAASEYARLDAWLDDDGEDEPVTGEEGAEASRHIPPVAANGHSNGFHQFADEDELPGFDDNFGPPAGMPDGEPALPLDPTPLLLHLQQVRADLSQVEDEDERRVRAAQEVTRVMQSLGFGAADWDDPLEGVDAAFDEEAMRRLERLDLEED